MVLHELENNQKQLTEIDTQKQLANIYTLLADLKDDLKKAKTSQYNVDQLLVEITRRDDRIASLENRLFIMETAMKKCEMKCEQFQRRHIMRVNNVKRLTNGGLLQIADTENDIQQQIVNKDHFTTDYADVFSELANYLRGNISEKELNDENNGQRFTKNIMSKNKKRLGSAKAYLDLTKRRYNLRKKATEKIKGHPGIDFVFADVNCTLCLRLVNGSFIHFSSEAELDRIVNQLNLHLSLEESSEEHESDV